MKILITGATGLLGREVFKHFSSDPNIQLTGIGFKRAKEPILNLDLTNENEADTFFNKNKFDLIVHCAAERDPGVCEVDFAKTDKINLLATKLLIKHANQQSSTLYFISTDYVFDGKTPPYNEFVKKSPLNYYGKTKSRAEDIIQSTSKSFLILRIPVLYGPSNSLDESAITKIAKQIINNKELSFDNWAIRAPTFTTNIAKDLKKLIFIFNKKQPIQEILHYSAEEHFTKYQMALIIANILNINSSPFIPLNEPIDDAPRPKDCRFNTSKINTLITSETSKFEEQLRQTLKGIQK